MFREGGTDPAETLFISHVPGALTKRVLREKGMVRAGSEEG